MRIPSIGKLAVFAAAMSFLVSGTVQAQAASPATPATPASPATPAKPAAPAATKDHATKTAKAKHKRSHHAVQKAKSHRKEKAAS
ncbi:MULTISPECIES: hypothetical protein [Cupriavidus]|jgi:hypothetical protein|nr:MULTISPECIES: hypothetical protein [Cupriavidus]MCA7086501.1 hypothetical protein [Cupriavidus sp. DB3]